MTSREAADESARQVRMTRARLHEKFADAHERVGETQHATEERMHRVADKLPDSERIHRRAEQLSHLADEHLDRAARERALANADEGRSETR